MTSSGDTAGSQKNIADHGGAIYSGTFTGSPIATATGQGATASNVSSGVPGQLVKLLRDQLAEARRQLEENHAPGKTADREEAIREIAALDSELAGPRADRDVGKLHQRLKSVRTALVPVADVIGGAAALLDIIAKLKAVI